jgi:protein-S-isoprenylcysteine O-methyltransferase Ste14
MRDSAVETVQPSGPGAPLPPTLIYLAGFALGWWMENSAPIWPTWHPPAWLATTGWFLCIVGLLLFVWGLATFARFRTGIMLQRAATCIVDAPPYSWSRNPQYVSFTMIYVGASLAMGLFWPLLILPLVLLLVTATVINREERYMRSRFGNAYDDYCRRVRRWI